jgi:hypothetical protein
LGTTPETSLEFPALEELPKQKWVENLPPQARADYERIRAETIARDEAAFAEQLRSYPGFESVPEEAILNYAHRRSTRECDAYEEGHQHGRNVVNQVRQAERDRDAEYHIQVLGGHG